MVAASLLLLVLLCPVHAFAGSPDSTTEKERKAAPLLTILFFTASWCEPCRAVDPILEKFTRRNEKSVKLIPVDFDSAQEQVARWDVEEIPVVIVISDEGEVLLRSEGADRRTLDALEPALERVLKRYRKRSQE